MADRELVERAQRGDRDAYERLALGAGDRLFGVAYRILRDTDRAKDAVQQTLVAIWTDLPKLREPDRFDVWTYRMVVRYALAETRRHRRIGVTIGPIREDEGVEARDDLDVVGLRDQLEQAFKALTPEHRAVLVLHHYLDLPHVEVAAVLGIPVGTVGSRLHRANQQLRAALEAGTRIASAERALA
jgi:RNA polymerase sigma-70 factor, ECF subfamily